MGINFNLSLTIFNTINQLLANQADGPCTIEYNRQLEWLSEHPGVLDGPDFPECTSDGYFESKQCNDFTRVCWCVDTRIGTHIPGTEGKESCDCKISILFSSRLF